MAVQLPSDRGLVGFIVQWHWIGYGLVGWLSIGNQLYLSHNPLAEWLYSGTGVAMDWLSGYPLVIRYT